MPKLFGARTGDFAASSGAGAGKNRVGCLPGNSEAARADCVEGGVSLCAWRGSRIAGRRRAPLWRISPEPAKHADGASDARHVRTRPASDSPVPRRNRLSSEMPSPCGDSRCTVGVRHAREVSRIPDTRLEYSVRMPAASLSTGCFFSHLAIAQKWRSGELPAYGFRWDGIPEATCRQEKFGRMVSVIVVLQ